MYLEFACAMLERAEQCRSRAHAIDLHAFEQARDELVAMVRDRMAELRIEWGIRQQIAKRDDDITLT